MTTTQSFPAIDPPMGRIRRVSKILRAITLALLIVFGAALIAAVFLIPMMFIHHLPVFPQCVAFIFTLLSYMIALNCFHLFTRLIDGHLFEGKTIDYLERAGKWWIALGIAQIVCQLVRVYFFPHHQIRIPEGGIFTGFIVLFIAWVLREGQKIKEEQELTV